MNWQPIESAPKDGTWVLLTGFKFGKEKCISHWYVVGMWDYISHKRPEMGARWFYGQKDLQYVREPTHWAYLPEMP